MHISCVKEIYHLWPLPAFWDVMLTGWKCTCIPYHVMSICSTVQVLLVVRVRFFPVLFFLLPDTLWRSVRLCMIKVHPKGNKETHNITHTHTHTHTHTYTHTPTLFFLFCRKHKRETSKNKKEESRRKETCICLKELLRFNNWKCGGEKVMFYLPTLFYLFSPCAITCIYKCFGLTQ